MIVQHGLFRWEENFRTSYANIFKPQNSQTMTRFFFAPWKLMLKYMIILCLIIHFLTFFFLIPKGETGKFYKDGVPDRSSIESYDVDLQKSVWRMSSKLMNIRSSNLGDDLDDISLSWEPAISGKSLPRIKKSFIFVKNLLNYLFKGY